MRSLTIHPASLALGLTFGGVALLSMGQATFAPTPLGSIVHVEYMPHPRDMVQLVEGTPYTVPTGKIFAATALGTAEAFSGRAVLKVNGIPVHTTAMITSGFNGALVGDSILEIPPGLTARAGDLVEVWDYNDFQGEARAWGYLAPQ